MTKTYNLGVFCAVQLNLSIKKKIFCPIIKKKMSVYNIIDLYTKDEIQKDIELDDDFVNKIIESSDITKIARWIQEIDFDDFQNYQDVHYLTILCRGDMFIEAYRHAIPTTIENEYINLYFLLKQNLPFDSQFYIDFLTSSLFWKYGLHDIDELKSNTSDYFNTTSIYDFCNIDDNYDKGICSCFSERQYEETMGDFIKQYCSHNDTYCKTVLNNMQSLKNCDHYSPCHNSPLRQAFEKYALYNHLNLECPNNDFVNCNINVNSNIVNDIDLNCFNCSINKNCVS